MSNITKVLITAVFCTAFCLSLVLSGCVPSSDGEDDGTSSSPSTRTQTISIEPEKVTTEESNNDGLISPGELTKHTVLVKTSFCSENITASYEVCLYDRMGNGERGIAVDVNGNRICSSWEASFVCRSGQLTLGENRCLDGYCSFTFPPSFNLEEEMSCGWRMAGWEARSGSKLLDRFTAEEAGKVGFELLPVIGD